jgi:hypothetical protein
VKEDGTDCVAEVEVRVFERRPDEVGSTLVSLPVCVWPWVCVIVPVPVQSVPEKYVDDTFDLVPLDEAEKKAPSEI